MYQAESHSYGNSRRIYRNHSHFGRGSPDSMDEFDVRATGQRNSGIFDIDKKGRLTSTGSELMFKGKFDAITLK
jgi:hypothetical protein